MVVELISEWNAVCQNDNALIYTAGFVTELPDDHFIEVKDAIWLQQISVRGIMKYFWSVLDIQQHHLCMNWRLLGRRMKKYYFWKNGHLFKIIAVLCNIKGSFFGLLRHCIILSNTCSYILHILKFLIIFFHLHLLRLYFYIDYI